MEVELAYYMPCIDFIIATWRLVFQAPLVACNNNYYNGHLWYGL